MIEIKDLFLKFQNILISEEFKKETIRKIISQEIKIEIKAHDIDIKKGVIKLNIKPIYKNEIFLKQEIILEKIQKELGKKSPSELR